MKTLKLHVPDYFANKLKRSAKRSGRSLSEETRFLVQCAFYYLRIEKEEGEDYEQEQENKRYNFCMYSTIEKAADGIKRLVQEGAITGDDKMEIVWNGGYYIRLRNGPNGEKKDFPYPTAA